MLTLAELTVEVLLAIAGAWMLFAPEIFLRNKAKPLGERTKMALRICGAIAFICNVALLLNKLI
jgi:hypothetical protein